MSVSASPSPDPSEEPPVATADDRSEQLERAVENELARGRRRVESRGDYDAVIVKAKRVNLPLWVHIFLCFITLGFWVFSWVLLAAVDTEQRFSVTVDGQGRTAVSQLR